MEQDPDTLRYQRILNRTWKSAGSWGGVMSTARLAQRQRAPCSCTAAHGCVSLGNETTDGVTTNYLGGLYFPTGLQ